MEEELINTSILITKSQKEYIERNSINLSDWVRKKLDKEVELYGR